MLLNNKLPTSTLLDLKVGDEISNDHGLNGIIEKIEISETDEFLSFRFILANGEIEVRKLKQVC